MKKFAKLIPVALGLLTLASCSNDDLFSEQAAQPGAVKLEKGEMLVTLAQPQEDGSSFTRGYTSRDMKQRRWWSGVDKLIVYGSQFGAYDTWMFQQASTETSGKFKIVSSPSYVDEPKWALFPFEQIENGKWELVGGLYNSASTVDVNLPQTIKYDAAYDAAKYEVGDAPYYLDNLPRFGEVESTNGGEYISTKLNFMTGILRLQFAGTPKYANGIKVQLREAGDPAKTLAINGVFTVKIAQNDVMISGASIEANGYAVDPDVDGAIYVYIEDIEKLLKQDNEHSVIYLPLPTWNKQVDIVVSTPDPNGVPYDGSEDGGLATWNLYKTFKNKTIQLGKVYGNKSEYNLAIDGTNPEAITDALEMIQTDEETITLVATNPIDVCEVTNNTVIEIPNKEGVKNIIIDLRAGLDGCAADQTLKVVYANSGDKFTGNVTLITPTVDGTYPVKLDVNLDESGFAIVQGGCIQQAGYGDMDIDAAEFVIGNEDKFTPTQIDVDGLKFSKNVTSFVVAKEGELNGNFVMDQSLADEKDWVFPAVTSITVNGVVDGNIDAQTNTKPGFATNITIAGEIIENGAYPSPTVTGKIKTRGNVDINAGRVNYSGQVTGVIVAEGDITATGYMVLNDALTAGGNISLAGNVNGSGDLEAKGNISIIEQASVPVSNITSNEGNITIDNAYSVASPDYSGVIAAPKGSVSLNEIGKLTTFSGNIIASNEFTMTGLTKTTGNIEAPKTATINVDAQSGNCIAVEGTLTLDPYAPTTTLNLLQGYVKSLNNGNTQLFFASEGAYAAIASVFDPDHLAPQNASVWNGNWKMEACGNFESDGYNIDGNRIWTATQLAYMNKTEQADVNLRSDINLDNQTWPGIESTGIKIAGNYKTISNLKIKGNKNDRTAGFINKATDVVTISNLTFDGVQTDIVSISGGKYEGGIGAVAGRLEKGINLSRVIVKLAGENFGTKTDKNVQTANVGGLIGCTGWATLTGVQVDASATSLTGYKCMGGFIGRSYNDVSIKMAEEEGDDPEVIPTVTGLKFYVTFDATEGTGGEINDPYQGTTGQFIGSISLARNVTIADVDDVKPTIVANGKAYEGKAFKIEDTTHRYFFKRFDDNADQTLIGNSGFEVPTGVFTINGKKYEVFKTGYPYTVGSPKLYSLINEPHVY